MQFVYYLYVFSRFLIGREKEGVESEVARLINVSLEMENTKKVWFWSESWIWLKNKIF